MSYEFHIAGRYLRAKRQSRFVSALTFISVAGVAVGVMALIVVLSVMTGFEEEVRDKIIGLNAHGKIHRKIGQFPDDSKLIDLVSGVEGVRLVAPFLSREVMISSRSRVSGLILKGIDVGLERQVIDIESMLIKESDSDWSYMRSPKALLEFRKKEREKEWTSLGLDPRADVYEKHPEEELPALMIGQEMAHFLHVWVGDEVTIINPFGGGLGPNGPIPSSRAFRIGGVFYSGMFEYDMQMAFVSLAELQDFSGAEGSWTGLEFLVNQDLVFDADEVAAAVQQVISKSYELPESYRNASCEGADCVNFEVKDWMELNASLFAALKVEQLAMFIILTFITIVAAFNIASKLIMMVIEKHREIAILKSMGASNAGIRRIFQYEGLAIGGFGTLLGLGLGLAVCALIPIINDRYDLLDPSVYYMTKLPVKTDPVHLVLIVLSALGISWVATLLPSIKASRMHPIDGIRDE